MRRSRPCGSLALAVLAFSGAAAGSAAAVTGPAPNDVPEFVECLKLPAHGQAAATGRFKSSACDSAPAVAGTGKYEAFEVEPGEGEYTSTIGKAAFLEGANGSRIECKAMTASGLLTGPKTGMATQTYTHCQPRSMPLGCQNYGSATGVIVTNPLETEVAFVDAAKKEVGEDFKAAPPNTDIEEFECGGSGAGPNFIFLTGSVIGKLTPIDSAKAGPFAISPTAKKGVNAISSFEGQAPDTLVTELCAPSCTSEASAEVAGIKDQFASAVELKALEG